MRAYYNEIDAYNAAWLRNLIAAGLIPDGDVDERSIADVQPDDLVGYGQCHFFAGIGGGAYACRLAGWPDDRVIWTGGPPCQPFSTASAGKRGGLEDDRHLWPEMRRLVAARKPRRLLLENVVGFASMALEQMVSDLEALGYEVPPPGRIPSAAVGRDHIRPRYWIPAYADGNGEHGRPVDAEVAELPRSDRLSGGMVPQDGIPADVAGVRSRILAAFGNSWDPGVAAEVIRALKGAA